MFPAFLAGYTPIPIPNAKETTRANKICNTLNCGGIIISFPLKIAPITPIITPESEPIIEIITPSAKISLRYFL